MSDQQLNEGKIAALRLLKDAYDAAAQAKRNAEEFAVAGDTLRQIGATDSDLRWLLAHSLAEQIIQVGHDDGHGRTFRTFRAVSGLEPLPGSCFVLTYGGHIFAERFKAAARRAPPKQVPSTARHRAGRRVRWDNLRHELWVDGKLAKRFLHAAPAQWAVLDRFQSGRWKGPVTVELSGESERDLAQRVRELARELNRGLDHSLVKFRKDPGSPGSITFDLGDFQ